jgi:uncharacterized membrane protein
MKIKTDHNFFIANLPAILTGGIARALEDANFLPAELWPWTVTPGIYLLIFAITFSYILLCKYVLSRRFGFTRPLFYLNLVTLGAFTLPVLFRLVYVLEFFFILIMSYAIFLFVSELNSRYKLVSLKSIENRLMLFAHIFDGFASFFAIGVLPVLNPGVAYFEQHVVGSFIMGTFGTWAFVPIKIIVALVAIYYIDRETDDPYWSFILKYFVVALGMGPGLRDALRLMMGV